MDWLGADNIVAVLTALLGIAASIGVVWYERRVPRRKRIGYRVQMDTPIGSDNRNGQGRPNVRLGLFNDLPGMSDATLVLLRIENDSAESIGDADYTNRDPSHGLTVEFADRLVRGAAVTQSDAEHLMDYFVPAGGTGGIQHHGGAIQLPRVPLNRGEHFKLLVLLTGGPVGGEIRISGGIREGVVTPNRSTTVDDKPPLFSKPARWITLMLTVCMTVLAGIVALRANTPPPIGCATGELTVTGSTAFAPVMEELASSYQSDCPNSKITVTAHGSEEGVRELAQAGASGSHNLIALSDGPKPDGEYRQLAENRVAISAFSLVVNDRVTIHDLTTKQIRQIYQGQILNWKKLDGPDLPILLISRNADSGTRDLMRRRILGGRGEPAFTSRDCQHRNSPQDKVIRCELDSTDQVLRTVAALPGAIGYSESQAASVANGLHPLSIDGQAPTLPASGEGSYPFVEVEYAYTYGRPPVGSLTASFLNYTIRGSGQDVIKARGHLPCYAPEGLHRCQKST